MSRSYSTAPAGERSLLKVPEVAAELRVGVNQAYELVRCGDLAAIKIGRAIRVTREALEEFKTGTSQPAA